MICLSCRADAQENPPVPAAVEGVKGVKQEAVQKIKNVETGTATSTKDVNKVDGVNTINGVKADGRAVIPPVQPVVPPPVAGTAVKVETGSATGPATTAKGVNKVDGIDTINGVKADGHATVPPVQPVVPPPVAGTAVKVETGSATGTATTAKGVNKVDGIDTINGVKAEGHAVIPPVQHVPPPPVAGTAAMIQAVQGVAGINAAKLQNLEAALKLKQAGTGTPTDKGKAAAAALGGPGPGIKPGPKQDGRDAFQEFQKLQTNGS